MGQIKRRGGWVFLTKEEERLLLDLHAQGYADSDIARQFGLSKGGVKKLVGRSSPSRRAPRSRLVYADPERTRRAVTAAVLKARDNGTPLVDVITRLTYALKKVGLPGQEAREMAHSLVDAALSELPQPQEAPSVDVAGRAEKPS